MRKLILLIAILLSFIAQGSYAYTGKIWTNTGDASSVDSGITYDSYGNWALAGAFDHDGILNNFTGTYWVTGLYNNGLDCAGDNDYVSVADADIFSSTAKSIRVVVKLDTLGTNDIIFGKPNEFWIVYNGTAFGCAANKFCFTTYNGSAWQSISSTSTVSTGVWYRIFVTMDSSGSKNLYINETLEVGPTTHTVPSNGTSSLDTCSYSGAASTYAVDGIVDDIAYYNAVVSNPGNTEISDYATNLVSIWHFNETSGSQANDSQGISSYPTNSPTVTFNSLDLGYYATFDMSGFRATEILTTGSIKYQYRSHATDCASGSWNGTWLTRTQIQSLSDIVNVECIQFKAQLNSSDGIQFARVDNLTIPYSPYNTVTADVYDTYLDGTNTTYNYGTTSTVLPIGYKSTTNNIYLFKLQNYLIPRETITQVQACLYLEYVAGDWESTYVLRGYRVKEGNYWREGVSSGATAGSNDPSYARRGGGAGANPPGSNVNWLGSAGANTEGTDYYAWTAGDPEISLGASFSAGYRCVDIPLSWVRSWRDNGRNHGVLFKTDTAATHRLNLYPSENGTNPAYFKIIYSLNAMEPTTPRVINDAGHGYATYWTGQWRFITDSQASSIMSMYNEDRTVSIFKYDKHVWTKLFTTSGPQNRAGSLLMASDKTIHWILGSAGTGDSTCHTIEHIVGTYKDDPTIYNSAISVDTDTGFFYGSVSIDSNDKLHLFAPKSGCGGSYSTKYFTNTLIGGWTLVKANMADGQDLAFIGQRRPLYWVSWISGSNIYLAYSRADDISTRYEYDSDAFMMSNDGGTTWKNSAGTTLTLPIQYWDDDKIAPAQVEDNVSITSLTSIGSNVYASQWVNRKGGALGSAYISNFTGTNNDFKFGGGTMYTRIGQTYAATGINIGRVGIKVKKVGEPLDKLILTIHTDDATNGSGLTREGYNSPIKPSDITTSYQAFYQDFPAYTGSARIVLSSFPIYPGNITNPGFEIDTTGWITTGPGYWLNSGATLTRNTSEFDTGVASGQIVTGTGSGYRGVSYQISGTFKQDQIYRGSLRVKVSSGTPTLQLFFGGASANNCNSNIVSSTSWQIVSCNWTPTADVLNPYLGIRNPSDTNITVYIDTISPSTLTDYYVISTDNVPSYSGGNFRYYTAGAWNEDSIKDLNFELYQRTIPSPLVGSHVRKLSGGTWSTVTDHSPSGGSAILASIGETLFRVFSGSNDDIASDLNLRHIRTVDGGSTWSNATQVTTDATSNRKYFYIARNLSIEGLIDITFQSVSPSPQQTEFSDIYYLQLRLNSMTGAVCGLIDMLGHSCYTR